MAAKLTPIRSGSDSLSPQEQFKVSPEGLKNIKDLNRRSVEDLVTGLTCHVHFLRFRTMKRVVGCPDTDCLARTTTRQKVADNSTLSPGLGRSIEKATPFVGLDFKADSLAIGFCKGPPKVPRVG
ncbi:hypothetical protein CDAR_309701 [Caerostris darwini]|uniref:Uncharacterized protein n=1 Tax=Caerostris darwini TaxID=1538125 RepID=A0AAV4VZN7_9ARAC|nr:hypothetical protein CDAR_309701 [Caerostris darwini]